MERLEVAPVNQLPELSGHGDDPAEFADMVLTSLLAYPEADLLATYSPSEPLITWTINPHAQELYLESIEIAFSPSLASFQAVLSHIGAHYMGGQPFNGYCSRQLRQTNRSHQCHFYLSNSAETGFWIRVYALSCP